MQLTFSAVQVANPKEMKDIRVQVTLNHEGKLLEKGEYANLAKKYGIAVIIARTQGILAAQFMAAKTTRCLPFQGMSTLIPKTPKLRRTPSGACGSVC
jgi:hypothetical protein